MSTSRRSFLSLFGLAGAAVAAPTLAVATVATVPAPKKPLTITLRREKGFALTYDEVDNNFQSLAERLNEFAAEQKYNTSGRKPSWA